MPRLEDGAILIVQENAPTKLSVAFHDHFAHCGALGSNQRREVSLSTLHVEGQSRLLTVLHDHVHSAPIARLLNEAHNRVVPSNLLQRREDKVRLLVISVLQVGSVSNAQL